MLNRVTRDVVLQFFLQEVGHLRAIQSTVRGFPRPLLNLSTEAFTTIMNNASERALFPPFNPYANAINYLLASYMIPCVGANPKLQGMYSKRLVAGLLGVESGQDAVICALLYEQASELVVLYKMTVAEFTDRKSNLRNNLGHNGWKDDGLVVTQRDGADGRIPGNILAENSVAYDRTPEEILRILYGTGREATTGGFYPKGVDGRIARSRLRQNY